MKVLKSLARLFLAGAPYTASAEPAELTPHPLPPLEAFFGDADQMTPKLSPDGSQLAWMATDLRGPRKPFPPKETGRLAYLAVDTRGAPELYTRGIFEDRRAVRLSCPHELRPETFFWLADGSLLWHALTERGEQFLIMTRQSGTIPSWTALPAGFTLIGLVPGSPPAVLLSKSADSKPFPDLYRLAVGGTSGPELVQANTARISTWVWGQNGEPVAGLRWTERGAKEIVRFHDNDSESVFKTDEEDDARLLFASQEGDEVFLLTNKGTDLLQLRRLNLETGESTCVASDPLGKVDVTEVVTDVTGRIPLAVGYVDDTTRWQSLSPSFSELMEVAGTLGLRFNQCLGVDVTGKRWLVKESSDREPGHFFLIDTAIRTFRILGCERFRMDREILSETEPYEFLARDGVRIPGYLTIPRDIPPPWPTVVFPHGGPRMRTYPGFDERVQFLASRGYAVYQPNFRGSRGYGKAFMNAGDGEWGLGRMQTDITDGVESLVRAGKADRNRLAIMGGSYGGYAALAGATFTPALYNAAISLFGISDLNAYATQTPLEWAAYSGDTLRRLGARKAPPQKDYLAQRSPSEHIDCIKVPLLIYHGAKDPLVPVEHATKVVRGMRRLKRPVEFLLARKEGHGFTNSETEIAVYRAIELFLHKHLGGLVGPEPIQAAGQRLVELKRASGQ